ncbi:MAG: hypothetical protein HQM09_06215 [Candidatus Riflebacteria bacterium]|nr:hypothetical protein [Candidatus Riflebacteria bacterium]
MIDNHEPDPIEAQLEHLSIDEPSRVIFEKLQRRAVWNQPTMHRFPRLARWFLWLVLILSMAVIVIVTTQPKQQPESSQESFPESLPQIELQVPPPVIPVAALRTDDWGGLSRIRDCGEPAFEHPFGQQAPKSFSPLDPDASS